MDVRVVLVEPENPSNTGMIARAMKNFGYTDLYLVNPKFDISESRRMAVKAQDVLDNAKIVDDIGEALVDASLVVGTTSKVGGIRNVRRRVVSLRSFIENYKWKGKVAILFGRESIGLTNKELELCDVIVNIPTSEEYPCLNIANSVSIVLYECYTRGLRRILIEPVSRETLKLLEYYVKSICYSIGLPSFKTERVIKVLRNVIGRCFPKCIGESEARYLMMVARKVALKLGVDVYAIKGSQVLQEG